MARSKASDPFNKIKMGRPGLARKRLNQLNEEAKQRKIFKRLQKEQRRK